MCHVCSGDWQSPGFIFQAPGQLSDHASRQKVPLAASSPGPPNIGEHEKQQLAWP